MIKIFEQFVHGKLLLSSEYFVLDGSTALALPTRYGQSLIVCESNNRNLTWTSYEADGSVWFEGEFDATDFSVQKASDITVGQTLTKIFNSIACLLKQKNKKNNPPLNHVAFETHLTFPRNWGLGTSSTLIYLMAQYFDIDPYALLEKTFGGSGYDIACAGAQSPITYQLNAGNRIVTDVTFNPDFKDNLYFIYLEKKQNSREGISRYREKSRKLPPQYKELFSAITHELLQTSTLSNFEKLLIEHEKMLASVIELPTAQSLYFSDYWGVIKSLGAWGGDFVLATSEKNFSTTKQYFKQKGFNTVIPFAEIIINRH